MTEQPNTKNEKLSKYIYRDNSQEGKVIFECTATNILDADKLYKDKIHNDPNKQANVGCSIEEIAEE